MLILSWTSLEWFCDKVRAETNRYLDENTIRHPVILQAMNMSNTSCAENNTKVREIKTVFLVAWYNALIWRYC